MKHRFASAALLLSGALILSACSSGGDSPPSDTGGSSGSLTFSADDVKALGGEANVDYMTKLYDQAIAAGQKTITVYGITATSSAALYAQFSTRFPGIKVDHVTIYGPELQNRIASEQTTGQYVADNLSVSGADALFVADNKYVAEQKPPLAKDLPKEYMPFGSTLFGANTYIYTVSYNTDMVSEADAPKSFQDLLDPKWKGKIAMSDPNTGVFGNLFGGVYNKVIDSAWLEKLNKQDLQWVPSERDVFTAVSTGQVPIGINTYIRSKEFLSKDKLPVAFVANFKDGVGDGVYYRGTAAHAPNAIASDLLVAWWLTPEAMELLASQGQAGLMPGAPAISGQPPLDQIKINKTPSVGKDFKEAYNKWTDEFRRIFKK